MTFHPAEKPNGTAVVILPGGGFGKVVTNKEGTELADILNRQGVSAFVLSYRTKSKSDRQPWLKPLQDAQRAVAYVRANSDTWKINKHRIGVVGFSAGGHVAARLLCQPKKKSYKTRDAIDQVSHRPDFALLVYPWNLYDQKSGRLVDELSVPSDCPPTFLVHTDDDRSSSMGSVLLYSQLKLNRIPAEIHVYAKGGHGYGTRPVGGSEIGHWPKLAMKWLENLN